MRTIQLFVPVGTTIRETRLKTDISKNLSITLNKSDVLQVLQQPAPDPIPPATGYSTGYADGYHVAS